MEDEREKNQWSPGKIVPILKENVFIVTVDSGGSG